MSVKTNALKKVAVALGYGSAVSEYSGSTIVAVLKEIAVKMQCAASTDEIPYGSIVGVLNYIADNYGNEENEPYNLSKTETHATVTFKRNNKTLNVGNDILYNGDKIKITASPATGYDVTTLTVNGVAHTSGTDYTVNGHNVAVVVTGTLKTFDLDRTATNCTVSVTKGGNAVSDGEGVVSYGDVLTITATAEEGYTMTSLQVNGEDFTSGNTLTVSGDVTITATATNQYNLTRVATGCTVTVTKDGEAVADGTKVLNNGDVITITAVADAGKEMSTLDVNGQTFTSGNTLTVSDDVLIMATAN